MQTKLTTFDTMTDDIRGTNGWALMKHLSVEPHRVSSRTSFKNAAHNSYKVFQYVTAKVGNYVRMYGWGKSGTDEAWYEYDTGTDDWSTLTSSSGNMAGTTLPVAFAFEGKLYGFTGTAISKCTPGSSFTASWYASNYLLGSAWSAVCEPVQIGDNAYFAMDHKVYELATGGSALTERYSFSTGDRLITSIAAHGTLLSVMTYNIATQQSTEYIYNVGSTDTGYIESFNWGHGKVVCHESVNNIIMAVQDGFTSRTGDQANTHIALKRRSSSQFVEDARIKTQVASVGSVFSLMGNTAYVYDAGHLSKSYDDKLFTRVNYTTHQGVSVHGLLSYAINGQWFFEITDEFETDVAINPGFIRYGNQWFFAHSQDTSTIETMVYPPFSSEVGSTRYDSVLETRLIDHGDRTIGKELKGVSVSFEPLTSASYVKLYYKRPDDADWTLIQTVNTEDATRLTFVNRGVVPHYREIQFKIAFLNAAVTGFEETSEIVKDKPYDTK